MEKIIAFVDGSPYSASVCHHAAWIARRSTVSVELMHVLGRREAGEQTDLSGAISLGARTALLEELAALDAARAKLVTHRGRAILEDAQSILTAVGVANVTTRLRHGDIIEAMAENEGNADMILIGKRGEAADFAKGHLGSNLERIVRASHKPIFVASRTFAPIHKMMVAYDGGESAQRAIEEIIRNPLYAGLSVHIISVGPTSAEVKAAMQRARGQLQAAGFVAETGTIPGQPETALAKLVDEAQFDLLVMGAYGHSRIRSLIIGSTTTAMLRACKVPVVLVR